MKKPGRPKGSTAKVIAIRKAVEFSLQEMGKRALEGDSAAQETLLHLAAGNPAVMNPFLPTAA